ncbi:MAG: YdeI/OmpD-associated family protein [Kofleriaceae bacterium]|nr:YdeI/OmpD-associated family protein [Myxococcales bacterium]MCB9562837.1 YdeI/OmpD-associated family protein [Kofleriaceae bacterium]MCB9575029.1 YdeI/OmpD-associated family protein [Kofleriaceae bacterium]
MAPRNVDPPPDLDKANELHEGSPLRGFATVRQWRTWLGRNHDRTRALWVKLAKRDSGVRSISYEEARDHAIAFGWIDGLRHALDDRFYAIRFTPRSKRSKWSKINRDVAEQLIAAGEMTASGLDQVTAARRDGRWDAAYASAATIEMHPDLERALKANPAARRFFATVSGANRFAILYRVQDAKRPETRARRVEKLVTMLARGEVPHPDR